MKTIIRSETCEDFLQIESVNDLAFKQKNESLLIERLRTNPKFIKSLSIVAEIDNEVVAHILFFPIVIKNTDIAHDTLALAPMSVLPKFQSKGIGGKLIKFGLETAKNLGFKSVIVLGHKNYYPKFGFKPASHWNIKAPYEQIPNEFFMALELVKNGLKGISGTVEYPTEFNDV